MLSRAAIRICAVQAILGRTFAGAGVRDSAIPPLDEAMTPEARRPFVAVYTDEETADGLVLVFEIGVTARMTAQDPETGDPVLEDGVPLTDGEIELTIDAIQRQIEIALREPGNAWAELLGRLFKRGSPISQRGADSKDGLRFAARQVKYVGAPQPDPPAHAPQPEGSVWRAFVDAVKGSADPGLAAKAPLFEALLGAPAAPDWRQLYRLLGQSDAEHDALGRTMADRTWPPEIRTVIDHRAAEQSPGGLA